MRLLILLVVAVFPTVALGEPVGDPLREAGLRKARKIEVLLSDGRRKTLEFAPEPFLDEKGMLRLVPGDSVQVRFVVREGELTDPRVVGDPRKEDGCVLFFFKHKDGRAMVSVENPYEKVLHFRCRSSKIDSDEITEQKPVRVSPRGLRTSIYEGNEVHFFLSEFQLRPVKG